VSLRAAAEPVRADAERLAVETIPRIGVPWSRMRIGVTTTSVYLAPRQRGAKLPKRRRPNLAALLLGGRWSRRSPERAVKVVAKIDAMLGVVGRAWEAA
jgi:hypothetical protein